MSLVSQAADTAYTYRFISLLVTPWEKTKAYKLGIINEKGKSIKKPKTPEERSAYTFFHRLVFNIKRLLSAVPGGSSRIATFAAALVLLREEFDVDVDRVLLEMDLSKKDKRKIKKLVDDSDKKEVEESEGATTTADIAGRDIPLKFKTFVRRKKKPTE